MQPSLTAYDFACAMQAHWTKNLHNVSSPKLMSLWTVMGQTFLGAIDASKDPNSPDRHLWRVLRPETGVGKTQGVRIFSAMVAARNLQVAPEERVGVLIVTRQTDEADRLAAEINQTFTEMRNGQGPQEWGVDTVSIVQSRPPINSPVAVARHSKPTGRATRETVRKADILILTHSSYVAALDRLEQAEDDRWSGMIEWEGGTRHLTVIDETITSLLEMYRIDIDAIKRVLAYVPERARDRFPNQVRTLEKLVEILRHMRQHRVLVSEAKKITGDTSQPPLTPMSGIDSASGKPGRWRCSETWAAYAERCLGSMVSSVRIAEEGQ